MSGENETVQAWVKTVPPRGKKYDGDQIYDCPFCTRKGKLEVSTRRNLWYCHRCGVGGKFHGAAEPGTAGSVVRPVERYVRAPKDSYLVKYLRNRRGLSGPQIEALEPHAGPYLMAVYFPLREVRGGDPVGYQGRMVIPWEPKYITSPGRRTFWGLDKLNHAYAIVLCEGIFDAVWGPNRLALLGKSISESQIQTLVQLDPLRIIIFLDSSAKKEAAEIAMKLAERGSAKISVAECPTGKDPANLRTQGELCIRNARRFA